MTCGIIILFGSPFSISFVSFSSPIFFQEKATTLVKAAKTESRGSISCRAQLSPNQLIPAAAASQLTHGAASFGGFTTYLSEIRGNAIFSRIFLSQFSYRDSNENQLTHTLAVIISPVKNLCSLKN